MSSSDEADPSAQQQQPIEDGESAPKASQSALSDNIARKGKNAYYFAHAHKANGPAWDGKAEPKLLSRQSTADHGLTRRSSGAFDYYRSNITTYAFFDSGTKVKLYIDLVGIGEKCKNEDVSLDFTDTSFCLLIQNYKPDQPQCLSFGKLAAEITDAAFQIKQDRVVLTLNKAKEGKWHTIIDKGTPDHEMA
jgi:hypothetical protein